MELIREIKNLFETNNFIGKIFDLVAKTCIYKKFIFKRIEKYSKFIRESKRYNLVIETTNLCNAKCIMCPHPGMKRKKEIMKDIVFDKIIERLKEEKINPVAIILNGFGDPLTDNKIFERVKKLKKYFSGSVIKFYTNLGLAEEKYIKDILDSGLDEINISFNGATKQSYEVTMGISYEKTLQNLESLISLREGKKSRLLIRLSMTLVSTNEKEEKMFIKKWGKKVNSVSVNKVHTYGDSIEDASGKLKINFNKPIFPCKYLWNTIVIGVKGDLFLCCLDYEGRYLFGNILKKSILNSFNSKEFNKIRQQHLNQKIKNLKLCSTCHTPYNNGQEWFVNNLY